MKKNQIYSPSISVVALLLPVIGLAQEREQRPNIVYIMSDDHSYKAISAYGYGLNKTPNIDRIADEGICFTKNYVTNSISGPCRAAVLTGKFSHKNGFRDNRPQTKFDGSQQTFPKMLQSSGYQTAVIGKWHLGSTPTGFDYYSVHVGQGTYYSPVMIEPEGRKTYEGAYATDLTLEKSIDWLESTDKSKPFCLLMHFKAPHRNWMPAPEKMKMYEDVTFPVPDNFWDNYEGRQAALEQELSIAQDMTMEWDMKMMGVEENKLANINSELDRMTTEQRKAFDEVYIPLKDDFLKKQFTNKELAEWKYQRYMRDYMKAVSSVDDQVGKMIDYLKENNLWENTIVIYTSDQGFYLGEHGWFDKRFMYEESFRTPMVVSYPKMIKEGGQKSEAMLQNIDLAPTFLDLAGVSVSNDIQGESFVPVLSGKQDKIRDVVYYHYYEYPLPHAIKRHYGVRNNRYKLIHFYYDIDKWELYDLEKDPDEMNNVIADTSYQAIKDEMMIILSEMQVKYEDLNPQGDYDELESNSSKLEVSHF